MFSIHVNTIQPDNDLIYSPDIFQTHPNAINNSGHRQIRTSKVSFVKEIQVFLNDTVEMQCDEPYASWWKRQSFDSPQRQLLATRKHKLVPTKAVNLLLLKLVDISRKVIGTKLILQNIKIEDEGYYECECLNFGDSDNQLELATKQRHSQTYLVTVISAIQSVEITYSHKNMVVGANDLNVINVRVYDTLTVNCTSYRSRPAALLHLHPNKYVSRLNQFKAINNGLYDTTISAQISVVSTMNDKYIQCYASNGVSNKSSSSLAINIISKPVCAHMGTKVLRGGINRNMIIKCYMKANPDVDEFEWTFSSVTPSVKQTVNMSISSIYFLFTRKMLNSNIICSALNKVGSGSCIFQLELGASPDPPKECTITHSNMTLMIVCAAGFHQGDRDFFCYLELLDSKRNEFAEQARKKHSCTFLLTNIDVKTVHVFRLYTENKFGSNRNNGLIIRVGGSDRTLKTNKSIIITGSVIAAIIVIAIIWITVARSFNSLANLDKSNYACRKQSHNMQPKLCNSPPRRAAKYGGDYFLDMNERSIDVGQKIQMRKLGEFGSMLLVDSPNSETRAHSLMSKDTKGKPQNLRQFRAKLQGSHNECNKPDNLGIKKCQSMEFIPKCRLISSPAQTCSEYNRNCNEFAVNSNSIYSAMNSDISLDGDPLNEPNYSDITQHANSINSSQHIVLCFDDADNFDQTSEKILSDSHTAVAEYANYDGEGTFDEACKEGNTLNISNRDDTDQDDNYYSSDNVSSEHCADGGIFV